MSEKLWTKRGSAMTQKKWILQFRPLTNFVNRVMVRLIPMAKQRPARNRLFPIAISDASKRSTTPRETNPRPRQISPIPIF